MQLYLIRHAQSENNAKPPYARTEDPPLTSIGRLQAQYLATWLSTVEIDALITSPFRRTLQTANWVLDIAPQPIQVWHDIFERGGVFRGHGPDATEGGPGLGRAEIARTVNTDQCTIDATITESGWWGSRRRESDAETIQRAASVVQRLQQTFGSTEQSVAMITHADFKRCLLPELLGKTIQIDRVGLLRNTGITKLVYEDNAWQLEWLNAVTHLPSKLITGKES